MAYSIYKMESALNVGTYENDDLSLIDYFEQKQGGSLDPKLDVVRLHFLSSEQMTWRELFDGYQELRAITFSSGMNFVYNLLDLFENAEIIFGNEVILNGSLQEAIAYQSNVLERIRHTSSEKQKGLLNRIDDKSVHLFVARKQLSHEKIYLLKSGDGRKRVISGSANMSYNAFGGLQRENISCCDDEAAYDFYLACFEELKKDSTDEITRKALLIADTAENMDAMPISETIKAQKAITVETDASASEDIRFVMDTHTLAKELEPSFQKPEKGGRSKISPDSITRIRKKRMDELSQQRDLQEQYPKLYVDISNQTVTLNGKELDLSPSADDIRTDVELFLRYMDGFSKFHGDYADMQSGYYRIANWFFCSPFMAQMRDIAALYNRNTLSYPVFGLVYGQSKAGKTRFLETLLKMMIGQKPKIAAPDFTRTAINDLKRVVQGAPIIVDDLTKQRFDQHAVETIKNDDFGVSGHMKNYPAVVISANEDLKSVPQEVIRRTVICKVKAGLTNMEMAKNNVVQVVQQRVGTALYREYLRQMLDILPDMLEAIKNESLESAPDILAESSNILYAILKNHSDTLPFYVRKLSLEDYFGEQIVGKNSKDEIVKAWKINPKAFAIQPKVNELRYNTDASYNAERLRKELPETLEARTIRETLIMNLSEARKFFGVDFRKHLFQWKKG